MARSSAGGKFLKEIPTSLVVVREGVAMPAGVSSLVTIVNCEGFSTLALVTRLTATASGDAAHQLRIIYPDGSAPIAVPGVRSTPAVLSGGFAHKYDQYDVSAFSSVTCMIINNNLAAQTADQYAYLGNV